MRLNCKRAAYDFKARAAQTLRLAFVQTLQTSARGGFRLRGRAASRAQLGKGIGETQRFLTRIDRVRVRKAARAFDENDFVANDAIFFVQFVRKRGLFVKDV